MLALARLRVGDYFRAAEGFERVLELNSRLPSVNAAYGRVLLELGKPEEADEAFRRELEINPEDFESNFRHGIYLHTYAQEYSQALVHLQKALRSSPGNRDVRFQIGLVYSRMNRLKEAADLLQEVAREAPHSLEVHVTLARLYSQLQQPEKARRHAAAAERLRQDQAGQALIQQGHFAEALELFRRLQQEAPSDPRAFFFAGMALAQMGDWEAAADPLREAARLDPADPKYRIAYANALSRLGQAEAALATLGPLQPERVQQLPPDGMLLLSETYHRAGSHDEALQVLEIMARQDPSSSRISLLGGQIHLVRKDYPQALHFGEESIARQPQNNPLAYALLGTIRFQQGQADRAKEAYLEAVRQDPDTAEYLEKLGAVCLALNQSEEALRYLQRAEPRAEQFPHIYYLLAKAYEAQKQTAKAREALQRYHSRGGKERP